MAEQLTLKAQPRVKIGKNANRRLRAQGVIPAVFYDSTGKSLPLQVNEAELNRIYAKAGRTRVIDLEISGGDKKTCSCLIWDAEYYPTKNRFQHVDFYGLDDDRELKVRVPLEFTGTAKGTKLGGKLEVYRERIFILSKPASLPQKIVVDVSGLDVGQGLRIADLAMPDGVRAYYDANFAILAVNIPGTEKGGEEDAQKA
ncbi:MAG: 50S ribosomal protein L25/general stress protein Ctc [Desulfovibrio sp.]|jgi:large subunit ribosomal protein L25|nr:50S ribosomal protein L25/general stress protein Ctc [Desulfovibrio sp.]